VPTVDLNADLGEGIGSDDALLAIVSSASIACGGHAGDAATMRRTLEICRDAGVRAGAHPGYADRANFGRLRLVMPLEKLLHQMCSQLLLIGQIAEEVGTPLMFVKLHGALANQAAEDLSFAVAIFRTIHAIDSRLAALALDNSHQVEAAQSAGMTLIREAYADRAYTAQGLLLPRNEKGAVLHDVDAVVAQCVRLASTGEIVAIDGTVLKSSARSICLHGDTPGAVVMAKQIRAGLEAEGITIASQEPVPPTPLSGPRQEY
jgi:UPF0271 protein